MAFAAPGHVPSGPETLTAEDFETASVHSATPSYVSEAPSYTSSLPPPYTDDDTPQSGTRVSAARAARAAIARPPLSRSSTATQQRGLPPVPSGPPPVPSLSAFSVPNWPSLSSSPATRHYRSVAQRRVAAASDRIGSPVHRNLLDRVAEEEDRPRSSGRPASRGAGTANGGSGGGSSGGGVVTGREAPMLLGWGPCSGRPLEDPGLVGEESARRARAERIRREREEALAMENRRWDWYLSQMNNWPERQRRWPTFARQHMGIEERKSFMRRISGRVFG